MTHLISNYTKRQICSPDYDTVAKVAEAGVMLTKGSNNVDGRRTDEVMHDTELCAKCRRQFGFMKS